MKDSDRRWLLSTPFAHRGLHDGNKVVPENSLLAFEKAIQLGFSIELDIHLLSDGKIAVFHDETLERMCFVDKYIKDFDAISIKEFNLVNTEYKIPLLTEVLDLVNGKVPLLIEIKKHSKIGPIENTLINLLENYHGNYAIQSFNPFSIAWFAKKAPHILRGQLASSFKGEKINIFIKFALKNLLFNFKSKPDFIAYSYSDLPNNKIKNYRSQGIPILSWTIRSNEDYKKVEEYCDNIIFEKFLP